ncbi:hypothetical protein [Mesorhizobium sp. M0586]|uniref:hypothetical protein n=1 Tax=unclassified Mesorhizobium TaxID=325217 RepID=UPI003339B363
MMTDPHRSHSLIEHAAPPQGMKGHAGWVCGFSADAGCMEAFVESFTSQGKRERADGGRTYVCLCLDRSQPQIVPGAVPGMLHLPSRKDAPPYRLMHAKVALLAFRNEADPKRWALRVLLTTGNWTRQTTEDSIDLIWRLDVTADDLAGPSADGKLAQNVTDMAAARDFWRWLRLYYQCGLFDKAAKANTQRAPFDELERWLDKLKPAADTTPRFLDTRRQALITQLVARVATLAGPKRRNTLALGSGFWEGGLGTGLPVVPSRIVQKLKEAELLTRNPEITMIFENENCAALADQRVFKSMSDAGWMLRPPLKEKDNRRLHAKFLFSANWQQGSNRCSSAWAYLGSGNMTPAGFLLDPRNGGNLETGIITPADGLHWYEDKRSGVTHVGKVLPIDWHTQITDASTLSAGEGPPEREALFLAAPVSHLLWTEDVTGNVLAVPAGEDRTDLIVMGLDGEALPRDAEGHFPWADEQPAHVGVGQSKVSPTIQVPVLDKHSRLAARELEPIDLEQAIELLAHFPSMPEVGSDDDGDADTIASIPTLHGGARSEARYAIRRTMELIEAVATRQTMVPDVDWMRWTQRLHCVLIQLGSLPGIGNDNAARSRKSALVEALLALEVNPLTCLREPPFLPDYVEPSSQAFAALDAALEAAEANWGVAEFVGFEG